MTQCFRKARSICKTKRKLGSKLSLISVPHLSEHCNGGINSHDFIISQRFFLLTPWWLNLTMSLGGDIHRTVFRQNAHRRTPGLLGAPVLMPALSVAVIGSRLLGVQALCKRSSSISKHPAGRSERTCLPQGHMPLFRFSKTVTGKV